MALIPAERSLYRKMQVALDEAREGTCSSIEELVNRIHDRAPLNFTYYKAKTSRRTAVSVCSKEAIKRVVTICIDLGLIDQKTTKLTTTGIRAANRDYFNMVLRRQLRASFTRIGNPVEKIYETITDILSNPKQKRLPTWDEICSHLGIETLRDRRVFHEYLTILSYCKGIDYSQKKIYLPGPPSRSEE